MSRADARRRADEMMLTFDLSAKAGDIEEAEALCERVAFIRGGRIVADGPPSDLRQRFGADRLEEVYLQVVGR